MSRRVSVGLMYVFSLVSRSLGSSRVYIVIGDSSCPVNYVDRFALPDPTSRSVDPSSKTLPRCLPFFGLQSFRFTYLLDGLGSAPALAWTHVFASSNPRDDIWRARSRPIRSGAFKFLCLRALAWLGSVTWLDFWLDWLGLRILVSWNWLD